MVRTEFGTRVVLHFVLEPRQQGWVWTQSVPSDAHGDSFMSHLQSDTGTFGTSSLASASTPWAPYMESPSNETQCKAGQTDAVSDLQPVGHGRGGMIRAGGGGQ